MCVGQKMTTIWQLQSFTEAIRHKTKVSRRDEKEETKKDFLEELSRTPSLEARDGGEG